MTIEKILTDAHVALKGKNAWTKGKFAGRYDKETGQCEGTSKVANCFCAVGAIEFAAGYHRGTPASADNDRAVNQAVFFLGGLVPEKFQNSVVAFNDHKLTTKGEILALFRKGIKKAHKEGV